MKFLLYLIILATIISSLSRPWIGVCAYYLLSIMAPQNIWRWIFESTRVVNVIAIISILGFLVEVSLGKMKFSILRNKENFFILVLWLFLIISSKLSHYEIIRSGVLNANVVIGSMNKVFLFYFISILLVKTRQSYYYLIVIGLVAVVYHVYWANMIFLTGKMWMYGTAGRLGGPGGIYSDENTFAMFFVFGIPFLYFMGIYYKKIKLVKYFLWGCIPFAWHAIFLTGSRGGLISVGAVMLAIAFLSKSKIFGFGLIIVFTLAFAWQGGNMKNRAATINDVNEYGDLANPRIISWTVGIEMMKDHPVLGVGTARFMGAFPEYSSTKPHVAHNTWIQIAAENGVIAGLAFLSLFINAFVQFREQRKIMVRNNITDPLLVQSNNLIICSLVGFFISSIFLNLAYYENFYYLIIMSVVLRRLIDEEINNASQYSTTG